MIFLHGLVQITAKGSPPAADTSLLRRCNSYYRNILIAKLGLWRGLPLPSFTGLDKVLWKNITVGSCRKTYCIQLLCHDCKCKFFRPLKSKV